MRWVRGVAAGLVLLTVPVAGKAQSVGVTRCSAILANTRMLQVTMGTPETFWLHGYLVGRRASRSSSLPTVASVADNATGDAAAWQAVVTYCKQHDGADLAEAARAYAVDQEVRPGLWCSVTGCKPYGRPEGSDAFGSEAEESCISFNRVEQISPGHDREVFGPWLQGFIAGRTSVPTLPERAATGVPAGEKAQWSQLLSYCRDQPKKTFFDAAQALVAPPG